MTGKAISQHEIIWSFITAAIAISAGFIIFWVTFLLVILSSGEPIAFNSGGEHKNYYETLIAVSVASFVIGYINMKISANKTLLRSIIAGSLALICYLAFYFKGGYADAEEIIAVFLILPLVVLGGWIVRSRYKKKDQAPK